MTLAFLALLGAPYIYEISSLRVNIIKWQVKFDPVAYGLMYLSIINKMQCYTMVFITINALHVSGGSSANHQELKTVYTASGICRAFTASYRSHPMLCIQF